MLIIREKVYNTKKNLNALLLVLLPGTVIDFV